MTNETDATAQKPDDERKLTPANENPWYVLATLHGEQESGATGMSLDWNLHSQNRTSWNRWMATAVHKQIINEIICKKRTNSYLDFDFEITPFTENEEIKILAKIALRLNNDNITAIKSQLDPNHSISFSRHFFTFPLIMQGFIFPASVDFGGAHFTRYAGFNGCEFLGGANFSCIYEGDAGFTESHFYKQVQFSGSIFKKNAWFQQSNFDGYVHFNHTIFSGRAHYVQCKFLSELNFQFANFVEWPPDFRGAVVSDNTNWNFEIKCSGLGAR